ncbi:MAG: hypothetical protein WBX15_07715 [Thermoanaerobaculia bacterium]
MPKTLFYAGVVSCAVFSWLGLRDAAACLVRVLRGEAVPGTLPGIPGGLILLLALLVMITAVSALLLRMASLLAARNLFSSFFAAFSIAGAALLSVFTTALGYRVATLASSAVPTPDISAIRQIHAAAAWGTAFFVSLMILSLRPYFRIHARLLTSISLLPASFFVLALAQEIALPQSVGVFGLRSWSAALFLVSISLFLLSIAVHCTFHRHMYVEVTNLRLLLESRFDASSGKRDRFSFGNGGIAYNSH